MSNARLRRRYRHAPWYKAEGRGLFALDLGKRKVGLACFTPEGVLFHATTIHTQRDTSAWDPHITAETIFAATSKTRWATEADWVCEYPELRNNDRKNHHNIRPLQRVGNIVGTHLPNGWAEKYRPAEWKRNVDKVLHHRRINEALSSPERVIYTKLNHDGRDAVGIGLFALGRIDHIGRNLK